MAERAKILQAATDKEDIRAETIHLLQDSQIRLPVDGLFLFDCFGCGEFLCVVLYAGVGWLPLYRYRALRVYKMRRRYAFTKSGGGFPVPVATGLSAVEFIQAKPFSNNNSDGGGIVDFTDFDGLCLCDHFIACLAAADH